MDNIVNAFKSMKPFYKSLKPVYKTVKPVYKTVTSFKEAPGKCHELEVLLQLLDSKRGEMDVILKADKAANPCKRQKFYVETFFNLVVSFKDSANKALEKYRRYYFRRIVIMQQLDKHLKEGKGLLSKADQLMKEGLTLCEDFTRGTKLPVVELIGNTSKNRLAEALSCIRRRSCIIGIHGNLGAGKTNFMKCLYNHVFDDSKRYKAVFWAGLPQDMSPNIKSLQDCVAEAMQYKFEDRDVIRRSGLLGKKLKGMAPGHVVIFLDNVKKPFLMTEVGIPISCSEVENFYCTIVLTTASADVCNKMRCSHKFEMGLLPENEAKELFLYEAGRGSPRTTRSYSRKMEKVADNVAKQCARMPLAITVIAQSMTGKEDLCEWKNCLDKLKGKVEDIHGDEAKILEPLKFSFKCVKDPTIRGCFLDSATVLLEGHQLTREVLIQHWVRNGKLGRKCHSSASYDQGHTIINELKRVNWLEVIELNGVDYVSMNKWIRKMAENILQEEALP